jgi:cytochrome P450
MEEKRKIKRRNKVVRVAPKKTTDEKRKERVEGYDEIIRKILKEVEKKNKVFEGTPKDDFVNSELKKIKNKAYLRKNIIYMLLTWLFQYAPF